jgi:predicted phage terminase large subunit-like protein
MPTVTLDAIRPLYAFLDPHGGSDRTVGARLKKIASQAAIVVGGRDDRNYYIVDAWAERCSTDALIEKLYELSEKWNIKSMGGEENGMAGLFVDAVHRDAKWRNKHLPIVRVAQPTNIHKDYRIRQALQPLVGKGRLVIDERLTKLIEQFESFPLSPYKDLIDACASLVRFIPPRPLRIERNAELNAKLKYLRDAGAAPDAIDRVAAGKEVT